MGISGKKAKSSSSSTSGSAQTWATPYATQGAASVQGVFDANQPGLQALTNLTTQNLVPSLMGKFNSGAAVGNQADQFNSDVLSGKYLNGNPYLQQMIDQMRTGVTDQTNSQFSLAGRYGSGAHTGVLADHLMQGENQLRYQNYGDEMDRMGQASQMANAGNASNSSQLMSALGLGAEMPYTGSSNLADALGALFNGGTEKSKSTGAKSGLLDYLAAAAGNAAGAAAAGSAPELKTNVVKVGEFDDGLGIYEWNYRHDNNDLDLPTNRIRGVMADEVAILRPHALGPTLKGGFASVNYAAL